MRKGPGGVYDKWNIFVVICDTDIPFIDLLTLPENLSSRSGFSGVHTDQSLVFCVVFRRWLFVPSHQKRDVLSSTNTPCQKFRSRETTDRSTNILNSPKTFITICSCSYKDYFLIILCVSMMWLLIILYDQRYVAKHCNRDKYYYF